MKVLLGVGLLLVACEEKVQPPVYHVASTLPVTPTAPVVSASAEAPALPEPPPRLSRSVASFRKGQLDECTDVFLIPGDAAKAEAAEKALDGLVKKLTGGEAMAIKKNCEQQFQDRLALATCRITRNGEAGKAGSLWLEARYYNVSTTKDSDTYMRDCLKRDGDWQTAAKDDPEAARERMRQRAGKLLRMAEEEP